MSDLQDKDIFEEVESILKDELQLVSYKWLARHFDIPSNKAKRILFQYVERHGGEVETVYFVSGWTKRRTPLHVHRLVDSADLQGIRDQLDPVTSMHVFSVAPANGPDDAKLLFQRDHLQAQERFRGWLAAQGTAGLATFVDNACSAVRAPLSVRPRAPPKPLTPLAAAVQEEKIKVDEKMTATAAGVHDTKLAATVGAPVAAAAPKKVEKPAEEQAAEEKLAKKSAAAPGKVSGLQPSTMTPAVGKKQKSVASMFGAAADKSKSKRESAAAAPPEEDAKESASDGKPKELAKSRPSSAASTKPVTSKNATVKVKEEVPPESPREKVQAAKEKEKEKEREEGGAGEGDDGFLSVRSRVSASGDTGKKRRRGAVVLDDEDEGEGEREDESKQEGETGSRGEAEASNPTAAAVISKPSVKSEGLPSPEAPPVPVKKGSAAFSAGAGRSGASGTKRMRTYFNEDTGEEVTEEVQGDLETPHAAAVPQKSQPPVAPVPAAPKPAAPPARSSGGAKKGKQAPAAGQRQISSFFKK